LLGHFESKTNPTKIEDFCKTCKDMKANSNI
jgi:hypothetical protein